MKGDRAQTKHYLPPHRENTDRVNLNAADILTLITPLFYFATPGGHESAAATHPMTLYQLTNYQKDRSLEKANNNRIQDNCTVRCETKNASVFRAK